MTVNLTLDHLKFLHELLTNKGVMVPLDKCKLAHDTHEALVADIHARDPNYRTDNSPQGK